MKKLFILLCILFTLNACKESVKSSETNDSETILNEDLTTSQKIAQANGFDKWKDVSAIKFTFNVDRGEKHYERSWSWNPQLGDVMMISETDTVIYNRTRMDSISMKTDAAFINDKYWLLAPFNLVWDKGATFSEKENIIAPISKDTLNQLTILYGNEGGYTPGDAYDFYFGKDYKIKEWVYRQGNDSIPSMTTTWEGYKNFGGVEIATMHKDSTGNFKLYFTNIHLK